MNNYLESGLKNFDDIPIRGVKKTFEQLLEEQLANENLVSNTTETFSLSRRPAVRFLKRGEGLSRFNLKENISPQKEYKPGSKARQPLVDYSKPVPKPKVKESPYDLPKKGAGNRPISSKSKTATPPTNRKVAAVTMSPSKVSSLRRSNTVPTKKPDPTALKARVYKKQSPSVTTTTDGMKRAGVTPASPKKPTMTRPVSAMETGSPSSSLNKQVSPTRKKVPPLSPTKQSAPASRLPTSISPKKSVDSSFLKNIQKRAEKEVVETQELEVLIYYNNTSQI